MQAIGFTKHLPITNEESLMAFNLPSPKPKPHDLCVQVTAVSVNPVDVGVRKGGRGQSKTPRILGWDAVGIVTGIGNAVTLFKPGDRVFYVGDFKRPGSNSEYQLVDERIVAKAPQNLTDAQAAAMPLTALTAWEALFEKLHIDFEDRTTNHDQTILIINGAGGVGSIATQLAHLAGLHVIATASRPETQKWALAHGADQVVNHHQSLIEQVHALGYQTVDYILELNNIDQHWESMARLIKPNGRIASITENHRPVDLQKLTKKTGRVRLGVGFLKDLLSNNGFSESRHYLRTDCNLIGTKQIAINPDKVLKPNFSSQLTASASTGRNEPNDWQSRSC